MCHLRGPDVDLFVRGGRRLCLCQREEAVRPFVLLARPAVGEVAGRDDQLRIDPLDEPSQGRRHLRLLTCTGVEIGYVQDAGGHDRMRL
jgi:hypothetical protein